MTVARNILRNFVTTFLSETEHPYPSVRDLLAALTNVVQIQVPVAAAEKVGNAGGTKDFVIDGRPRAVIAVNTTTGCVGIKVYNMAGASAVKLTVVPAVTYAGNMITLDDDKFTLGTDAALNTNDAGAFIWIAFI